MIEIRITGEKPIEVLASMTACAMHCMKDEDILSAANQIYEEETAKRVDAAPVNVRAEGYTPPPAQEPAPSTEIPVMPPVVPLTDAPTYTAEQLARAGADLFVRDPSKAPEAQALLQKFGVAAVTELQKEQYGDFATALRGLGAVI